jgi:hypothetical protein
LEAPLTLGAADMSVGTRLAGRLKKLTVSVKSNASRLSGAVMSPQGAHVLSPTSFVRSGLAFHSALFSLCIRLHACSINSVSEFEVNGRERVGWDGKSVTAVRGARIRSSRMDE